MSKKKKTYVLDTNVLLTSPYSVFSFDEHDVCIADVTLEELDRNKTRPGEVGANAREAIRLLDDLRKEGGDLLSGVKLPFSQGCFWIEINHIDAELPESWDKTKPDNRILRVCKGLREHGADPILVSNDIAIRIKADLIQVPAEEYKIDQVKKTNEQYKGRSKVFVTGNAIDEFYKTGKLSIKDIVLYEGGSDYELSMNEFVLIIDASDEKHSALGRFDGREIVSLRYDKFRPYDVSPRNIGQKFAQEALMAPVEEAPLVILKGPAETAKTFYSLAVGLERVINKSGDDNFDRILVTRPNVKFDEDIGYLKGTEEDKIAPLIRPIMDNLTNLTKLSARQNRTGKDDELTHPIDSYVEDLFNSGCITAQAMAYMRGRSITDTWIIVDEVQNASPLQVFGIISRAGVGSKIILAGDPDQIDNPHLDSRTNGLSYASERMKGSALCRQVTFDEKECTRSPLALEAIKRLKPKGYTM